MGCGEDSLRPVLHEAILPALLSVILLDQIRWHFQHKKVVSDAERTQQQQQGEVTH